MEAIKRTLFLVPAELPASVAAAIEALWDGLAGGLDDVVAREDRLRRELVALGVPSHPLPWPTFRGWLELRKIDAQVRAAMDDALCVPRDLLLDIARRSTANLGADAEAVIAWLISLPCDARVVWLGAPASD
jgi:hypothetical protein